MPLRIDMSLARLCLKAIPSRRLTERAPDFLRTCLRSKRRIHRCLIGSVDVDELVARTPAANDHDPRASDAEAVGQQATQGPIRAPVERWRRHAYDQYAVADRDQLIAASACLNPHWNRRAGHDTP
jgi:hypothetical protein